jgi:arsenate reductase
LGGFGTRPYKIIQSHGIFMALKFYGYKNCDTCRKAKKFLEKSSVKFTDIEITENPPSVSSLKLALKNEIPLKKLFNTSGLVYREMNIKEKLPKMSEKEALDLLAKNGKLIKRPFVTDGKTVTVGFKEDVFEDAWV